MKTFTDYLWFTTKQRQEFVRITDEVAAIVKRSGVDDGMVLVSASHITAGVVATTLVSDARSNTVSTVMGSRAGISARLP